MGLVDEVHAAGQTAQALKGGDLWTVYLDAGAVVGLLLAFETLKTFALVVIAANTDSFAILLTVGLHKSPGLIIFKRI